MTKCLLSVRISLQNIKEIYMKQFLKKIIVASLLGGLLLAIGNSGINKPRPMGGIDPGPANTYVK